MEIKNFGIDFTSDEPPFFQVSNKERVRFLISNLGENPGLLKEIFKSTFKFNEYIDSIFISAYQNEDNSIQKETLKLGNIFKITNWKNHKVWNEDLDSYVIYTQIKKLNTSDLYKYVLKLANGYKGLYICFYNDDYLLYVNSDVFDIISNKTNIDTLKKQFNTVYDRLYD